MSRKRKIILILILACTNTAVYGVPYLKDMFYELMRNALGLSNTQMGIMCSCYGCLAIVGYIVGGILADKMSIKTLLAISGMVSGVLCFYLLTIPPFMMICIAYALMAIASVLTFYPTAMKTISIISGEKEAGSMYGLFYLMNSICGMVISGINIWMVSFAGNEKIAFIMIVGFYGAVNCVSSLAVLGFMDDVHNNEKNENKYPAMKEFGKAIIQKEVWILVIIVFTNYVLHCMAAYYNTYFINVLGYSSQFTYIFSIIRIYVVILIVSPLIGVITDKVKSSLRIINNCFMISTVCLIVIAGFYDKAEMRQLLVGSILICVITVAAVHVIAFVPITEIGIPVEKQGLIIGLMSFVGFSPDAYYYLTMGNVLDSKGNQGFRIVFIFAAICSVIGWIVSRKRKGECKRE